MARANWQVRRRESAPGHVQVSLCRVRWRRRLLGWIARPVEVLLAKEFPMRNIVALERYGAELEETARHLDAGTFGCFVKTDPLGGGSVRVRLYESYFADDALHTRVLTERTFDSQAEGALVRSAEFAEELRDWGYRRTAQQLDELRHAMESSESAHAAGSRRERAARELAAILQRVDDSAQG